MLHVHVCHMPTYSFAHQLRLDTVNVFCANAEDLNSCTKVL